MNFYIVPSVSFQTQEKLKKHKKISSHQHKKKKHSGKSPVPDTSASQVTITDSNPSLLGSSQASPAASHRHSVDSSRSRKSEEIIKSNQAIKPTTPLVPDQIPQTYSHATSPYGHDILPKPHDDVRMPSISAVSELSTEELSVAHTVEEQKEQERIQQLQQKSSGVSIQEDDPNDPSSIIASRFSATISTNSSPHLSRLNSHGPSVAGTANITIPTNATNSSAASQYSSSPHYTATSLAPSHSYNHASHVYHAPVTHVRPRSNSIYSHTYDSNYHRTSPLVHIAQKDTPQQSRFRKLSFLTKKSGSHLPKSNESLDATEMKPPPTAEPSMGRASERFSIPQGEGTIPPFRPFTDLTILNSMKEMEQHMYSPGYQIFRYNNFLYLLSEYHPSDAVNFANVRNHSLLKFIIRQKRAHEVLQNEKSKISTEEHYDVRIYESFLAYELYSSRVFMRQLIKQASFDHQMYNHEELVQTNISNYIRYLLNLPVNVNVNELNDVEKKHYEFKALFKRIADALYQMKKDETSDEISNEKEIKTKLLLEAITKVSYEYILLEKYNIEILNKFSDNNILEKRVLKYLFNKFHERVKVHNPESTKLLLFNTFYSVQYGWYLAVACPFVRVFETNVYAEDKDLIANKAAYEEIESKTSKRDFSQSDQMMFDTYFKKLMFSSFQEYSTMSSEKLIKLLKLIDNQSPKYSRMNRHEIPDPSSTFSHKPMNFEYYSDGLATIESNSFDMIDSPDLPLQVTVENYKTIIGEFYRILKPGGIFETKSMQFGSRSVVDFLEKHKGGGYPRSWDFDAFNLECFYDVVPQFVEAILKELNSVFGTGNVKFTVLLVCANSEVNNFLIKFSGLKLFELAGKFNDYCSMFEEQGDSSMIDNDSSVHFVVHIRARKTVPFRSFDRET